jgi:tubulin--tyrosine ligase
MLVTSLLGKIKAYWYEEGYVRTSSKEFSMHNLGNRMVHLTNDAVQKMGGDYGRYESCNKLSFREMDRYFREGGRGFGRVREEMKALAKDCLRATYKMLDPRKREFSFEIFGLDFLIDRESKVWLI